MTDETAAPTPHPEGQRLDLEDLLPTQPIIWGADDELGGWKDDPWTYEKWARVAGHGPMANGTGCEQCGYDTSMCMFAQFHDAMITTVIRELDKIGTLTLARPVPQGTQDGDYREQIAQALVPGGDQSTFGRVLDVVAPLVEQLRQARAAYNRMAGHAVDRAAERDRYYLAWQSAARGRRQARIERDRQGDLTVARRVLDEVAKKAVWLESETQRLRADLEARTCERDEARQELAGEKHVRRLNEHGLLGQLAALRSIAVVLPEDWCDQLDWAYCGEHRLDLIESWRAAPVLPVTPDEHVREHDDAAPTRDKVAEAWAATWDGVDRSGLPVRPPTLAETRTGTDWCPSCRTEAGTNRYTASWGEEVIDHCATCGSRLTGASPGTGTEAGE